MKDISVKKYLMLQMIMQTRRGAGRMGARTAAQPFGFMN